MYLDWDSDFFESYKLLDEHKKDKILISYQRKNYQEIHHYKMLKGNYVQGDYINGVPYIDAIDYIYPEKTLHKKFKDVRWDLRHETFIVRDEDSPQNRPTFSKTNTSFQTKNY